MTANDSHIAPERASHQNGGTPPDASAAAPQPQRPDRDGFAFDIEDDLWRAAALNDIAHWIGKAKRFFECMERAVDRDEALQKMLRARGVGVFNVEWHDHHADGLEVLHMTIDDHLRAVRQISGIERKE